MYLNYIIAYVKPDVMTACDTWIKQGIEKGIEKGKMEEKIEE